MASKLCGGCRWWYRNGGQYGECRRYPPTPIGPDENDEVPLTPEDFFCGEWTACDEATIPAAPTSRPPETKATGPLENPDAEPYGWACRTAHGTIMFTTKACAERYAKEWLSRGVHVMANVFPLYRHPFKESR